MRLLRRLLSVLLVLAFAVLLPAALVTAWMDGTVADTDGYVDAVAPLADEEAVQDAVTTRVRAAVVSAIDLPPGLGEDVLAEAVSLAVRRVVESDAFPPLWRASNEVAHRTLVDVLGQPRGSDGEVRIDVTPVVIRCEPRTLGKGVKWYRVPSRRFHLSVDVLPDLPVAPFLADGSPESLAARRLTAALGDIFRGELLRAGAGN